MSGLALGCVSVVVACGSSKPASDGGTREGGGDPSPDLAPERETDARTDAPVDLTSTEAADAPGDAPVTEALGDGPVTPDGGTDRDGAGCDGPCVAALGDDTAVAATDGPISLAPWPSSCVPATITHPLSADLLTRPPYDGGGFQTDAQPGEMLTVTLNGLPKTYPAIRPVFPGEDRFSALGPDGNIDLTVPSCATITFWCSWTGRGPRMGADHLRRSYFNHSALRGSLRVRPQSGTRDGRGTTRGHLKRAAERRDRRVRIEKPQKLLVDRSPP